jgi:hypothetical protein
LTRSIPKNSKETFLDSRTLSTRFYFDFAALKSLLLLAFGRCNVCVCLFMCVYIYVYIILICCCCSPLFAVVCVCVCVYVCLCVCIQTHTCCFGATLLLRTHLCMYVSMCILKTTNSSNFVLFIHTRIHVCMLVSSLTFRYSYETCFPFYNSMFVRRIIAIHTHIAVSSGPLFSLIQHKNECKYFHTNAYTHTFAKFFLFYIHTHIHMFINIHLHTHTCTHAHRHTIAKLFFLFLRYTLSCQKLQTSLCEKYE